MNIPGAEKFIYVIDRSRGSRPAGARGVTDDDCAQDAKLFLDLLDWMTETDNYEYIVEGKGLTWVEMLSRFAGYTVGDVKMLVEIAPPELQPEDNIIFWVHVVPTETEGPMIVNYPWSEEF